MLKRLSLLFVVILSLLMMSCSSETADAAGEQFGQGLSLAKAISINDVFGQADSLNGQVVRVTGTVSDLCKHKGCWMQVSDGKDVLTVTFKDEAFILPADAAGKGVDFEGLLIAEKITSPSGSHMGCAEAGEHSGEGACESVRAEETVKKVADIRYTMVSTGLVLL